MSGKNEMRVEVILTSGKYKLSILDHSNIEMREFMRDEMDLNNITFTFNMQSYPVIQNEERNNCPYLYLQKDFI